MLKALSYMCLDNYDRAAEVAKDIEIKSKHRFRVETWSEVSAQPYGCHARAVFDRVSVSVLVHCTLWQSPTGGVSARWG